MSKKAGRILKAPSELVALGSAPATSTFKRDPVSAPANPSRPLPPPEKRPKLQLQPVSGVKPPLAKKLATDLPGAKKDVSSETAASTGAAFDLEQFYSLVSNPAFPVAQADLLLKRVAFFIANNVSKLDNNFIISLLNLANERPELFRSSMTFTAFSALLHSKPHSSQERKLVMLPPVLAANVLFFAYRHVTFWPSEFIAFYIEDALGERIWIERPECSVFVYHLVKAFTTRLPPHLEEAIRGSVMKKGFKTNNELVIGFQRCLQTMAGNFANSTDQVSKFSSDWETVATLVSESVRDFMSRKQTGETQLQNLLKVMLLSCCFSEIRKIASEKLEFWLQNQKIVKLAQDLLMTVCMNSSGETQIETDTVNAIIKLKYASKQKHLSSHFLSCIRQLLSSNPPLARKLIVQHVAAAELVPASSGPRPIANVSLLDAAFSVDGGWATNHILADYFGEIIITAKEDPLKGLRLALRDIVNGVKSQQLNLKVFVDVLLKLTDKPLASANRDRVIVCVADIVCLAQMLSVSEMIVSAFENYKLSDCGLASPVASGMDSMSQNESTIRKFQEQIASIQLSAVKWWLGLKPTGEALGTGLRTLLMMDNPASYAQRDGFPADPDRTAIFKILSHNIPSSENLFQILIQSPFASEQHYYSYQLMDISCGLLARNASLSRRSLPSTVPFKNSDLINCLLEQSRYSVDKSYGEYHALAVTSIYWKAWIVILLSVAVNPSGLGAVFWRRYPTLRYLMEMCMTGCYEFPSAAVASQVLRETALAEEKKISDDERKAIDMLSSKLNAALGNQVMYFDPPGPARRPPDAFFVELGKMNDQIGIGAMLCKSRDPDFLQALTTQSQSTGKPMPWLRNLILNADDALYVLPVHCVCQFVLDVEQMSNDVKPQLESEKCAKLLDQMRSLVTSSLPSKAKEFQLATQIVVNFATRLSSPSVAQREAARRCLLKICSSDVATEETSAQEETSKLSLDGLFKLPVYGESEASVLKSLHEALNVELNVKIVSQYLNFILAKDFASFGSELREPLIVDVCKFLVERRNLSIEGVDSILPMPPQSSSWSEGQLDLHSRLMALLADYFSAVVADTKYQSQEFLDPQRHVKVYWKATDQTRIFHIVIVEAAVMLLSLAHTTSQASLSLMQLWFNPNADGRPKFLHVIDPEQMLSRGHPFKQDWLRQLLLNSSQQLLIETAFSYCSTIDLISLVRSFGIHQSVTDRFLAELDVQCVRSPTLSNDLMPTGDINDARFILRCVQVYQKRSTGKEAVKPGSKFIETVNSLITAKTQLQQRKLSLAAASSRGASSISGPSSPVSAPASPMEHAASGNQVEVMDDAPASPTGALDAVSPTCYRKSVATGQLPSDAQFFSLPIMFRVISNLSKPVPTDDPVHVSERIASEITRDLLSVREFAVSSPGVCSLLLNVLHKQLQKDPNGLQKIVAACQRLFKEAGRDWREIIRSSTIAKEMKEFMESQSSLFPDKPGGGVEDRCDEIESPVEDRKNLQVLVPDEIEFSDEQQIVKFIFLDDRWTLSDGLRLCSILFERRDAQVIWRVVMILLSTPAEELPRDCRLIFGFIDAAFQRPTTFLGREVATAKDSDLPLTVLPSLSDAQIRTLLEIVDRSFADNCDAIVDLLNMLIAKCVSNIDIFVDWIGAKLADEENILVASRTELTMKLYARVPGLLTRLLDKQRQNSSEFALRSVSSVHRLEAVADSTVQTLLLAIGSNDMRRGWAERIREATAMCRRLAILHPGLILNNLGLLATLLQGRNTSSSFPHFRSQNHHSIMGNLVNILVLLQPSVFANRHTEALRIVVDAFMEIFSLYISEADSLRHLITRFSKFIASMLNTNLPMAVKLLLPHRQLIGRLRALLRSDVPELETVDSILDSVVHAPSPTNRGVELISFENQGEESEVLSSEVQDLIERLERRRKSIEGLISILTEVEVFSRHRPSVLLHFSGQLITLLLDDSVQVSQKVHTLLDRLLRNVPGSLSAFFEQWLAAFRKALLSTSPPGIDALNLFLPEAYDMCSMFPERSLLIVELLFEMMASGRLTNTDIIVRCIRELNCDSMFTSSGA